MSDTIGVLERRGAALSQRSPARRPPSRSPVRLTARGRFLVVVASVVVVLAAVGFATGRPSGAGSDETRPAAQRTVVVQPGDTLWSIAREVAPDEDVRITVYEIRKLNGLSDAMIASGQVLLLPPE
jgi:nucleoid-associated protein YgaU